MRRPLVWLLILALLVPMLPARAALQTGQQVMLGRYPQQGEAPSPIRWRVLAAQENQALLLSDLVLAARPVQDIASAYDTFETSDLAAWLNGEFLATAFDAQEAEALLPQAGLRVSLPTVEDLRSADYGFTADEHRYAAGTAAAMAQGLARYNDREVSYWTATLAQSGRNSQRRVMQGGSIGFASMQSPDIGVRPLIRVDLSRLALDGGIGTMESPFALVPGSGIILPESQAAAATADPTPAPTPAPSGPWAQTGSLMTDGFPALTEEGFLPEVEPEHIFIDAENGQWRYASQTLRIVIRRHSIELNRNKVRYLEAHIFLKEGEDPFRMVFHDPQHKTEVRDLYKEKPAAIARNNNLVFSMDGDYFLYRVSRQKAAGKSYSIGVEVRGNELLYDDPASPKRSNYPPLDMMALFENGDMRLYDANEVTAQQLLQMDARDVLSFGPWMVRDGIVNDTYQGYGTSLQPRAGVGMYGRGHYLALIVEGRIPESKGMTTREFSDLFAQLGCPTAFNLDGGWTSAMVFMGQQLNQLDKSGVHNNARPQNEVMGIGYTEQYPEAGK